jgi:peptidoglycan/LPS O-acetylase OafA/YrhL
MFAVAAACVIAVFLGLLIWPSLERPLHRGLRKLSRRRR